MRFTGGDPLVGQGRPRSNTHTFGPAPELGVLVVLPKPDPDAQGARHAEYAR
jgi:hypothetical protein